MFVDDQQHNYKPLTQIELDTPELVKELEDKIEGVRQELITSKNSVSNNLPGCIAKVEEMRSSLEKKLDNKVLIAMLRTIQYKGLPVQ